MQSIEKPQTTCMTRLILWADFINIAVAYCISALLVDNPSWPVLQFPNFKVIAVLGKITLLPLRLTKLYKVNTFLLSRNPFFHIRYVQTNEINKCSGNECIASSTTAVYSCFYHCLLLKFQSI